MPDLRRTRKSIKTAIAVLLGVDVIAVVVFFSPLVGSTASRQRQLTQLSGDLRTKTVQVESLTDLPKKVTAANRQIGDFYKKRFPAEDSAISTQFGKLAVSNGVTINQAKYKEDDPELGRLYPVEIEANLSGNYISLAKFINALERDDMLFIINSVTLGGEQNGPIKLDMKLQTYLKAGTS
jgi:Tfp pilus assembly protein PilO